MNCALWRFTVALCGIVVSVQYGTPTRAANVMTELLQGEYLDQKTCVELRILRNEIFARHGRKFYDPDLGAHFHNQAWYRPQFERSEFPHEVITDLQSKNIYHIKHYEKDKECGKWKMPFNINEWTIIEWSAAVVGLAALVTIAGALVKMFSSRRRRGLARTEDL